MAIRISNLCIRCGKVRIDSRTWSEEVQTYSGKTLVTYTETVCPDAECQKKVVERLDAQKLKNETMQHEREERNKIRIQNARRRN